MPTRLQERAQGLRVLVLDDDAIIRDNLATFLEDEDYDVLTAATGEQALSLLDARMPDLGIVDVRLPGMDGNAFVLAAHQVCPEMKFLIHTGSLEYVLPQDLRALGLSEGQVLRKPVGDMHLLLKAISRLTALAHA